MLSEFQLVDRKTGSGSRTFYVADADDELPVGTKGDIAVVTADGQLRVHDGNGWVRQAKDVIQ